ncbi:hypothetical protein SDC9_125693 [bioreactor metagenome]|uniref:Uncharacterized protein n=1 Tax=bioreactor metagenome TaxID=1076179 RepID=A0A645CPL6_9ZZZZ
MAEDNTAEWPGQEPDAEGGERQQGAGECVGAGEEELREHQGGGRPEDEEVVVLDGGADEARHRHGEGFGRCGGLGAPPCGLVDRRHCQLLLKGAETLAC